MKVYIEGSGRHVHLTKEHLEQLFGRGFELEPKKMLSQPGEFASTSRVDVEGAKTTLKNVVVIGPCRAATQVELSFTDARSAGIDAPLRESGDVRGSASCKIHGPAGSVEIPEGAIVAKRHVHFTPEDAARAGIRDKDIIKVRVDGPRAVVFEEVLARVSPVYATYMHIDYDEMNAAMTFGETKGEVIV